MHWGMRPVLFTDSCSADDFVFKTLMNPITVTDQTILLDLTSLVDLKTPTALMHRMTLVKLKIPYCTLYAPEITSSSLLVKPEIQGRTGSIE